MAQTDTWMVCSACRKPIPFGATYQACSVSTCNRPRTRVVFCSVPCWDSHVVVLRHRDAWAVESVAGQEITEPHPAPEVARAAPAASAASTPNPSPRAPMEATSETEILIVVSKMKKYIKERSGMSCSDAVAQKLSDHVRAVCDVAIRNAGAEGRKTVLDRDVPRPE